MIQKDFLYYFFIIISFIFHPVFMATIGVIILILFNKINNLQIVDGLSYFIVIYISLITVVIPLISIALARFFNIIKSFEFNSSNDRIIVITIYTFCLFLTYNIASKMNLNNEIILFLSMSSIISTIALLSYLIKNFKISLHMIGIGGITAILLYLLLFSLINITRLLFSSILLSGIIGSARLYLQKHNSIEVYSGYVLGFLTMFLSYYFSFC